MYDREIVHRVTKGDQSAMRAMIAKYQDLVLNTCYRVLHNPADAEDIAQEVFIEAYRSISTIKHQDQLSYWLYRIALNKSVNYQKKNRFFNRVLRIDHLLHKKDCVEMTGLASADNNAYQDMVRTEKVRLFKEVLGRLPARQHKALVLHHFEQLSYK